MEELKKFCNACQEEKNIIEIERDTQGVTFKLSCGHKIIEDMFIDTIKLTDQLKDKAKRPGIKKPIFEGMERTKTSGDTQRPAKESIFVEKDRKLVFVLAALYSHFYPISALRHPLQPVS